MRPFTRSSLEDRRGSQLHRLQEWLGMKAGCPAWPGVLQSVRTVSGSEWQDGLSQIGREWASLAAVGFRLSEEGMKMLDGLGAWRLG